MQVIFNGNEQNIKISSISTLLDILFQIEKDLPQDFIVTELKLNGKTLDSNWYHNAKSIYLLDEDKIEIKVEHSSIIAKETLLNSKNHYNAILADLSRIADMFRMEDETKANTHFVQAIENLQWFFKIVEDTTELLGKPVHSIVFNNKSLAEHIKSLEAKLEEVITIQQNKDWILLADLIEYEVIPILKDFSVIYTLVEV